MVKSQAPAGCKMIDRQAERRLTFPTKRHLTSTKSPLPSTRQPATPMPSTPTALPNQCLQSQHPATAILLIPTPYHTNAFNPTTLSHYAFNPNTLPHQCLQPQQPCLANAFNPNILPYQNAFNPTTLHINAFNPNTMPSTLIPCHTNAFNPKSPATPIPSTPTATYSMPTTFSHRVKPTLTTTYTKRKLHHL